MEPRDYSTLRLMPVIGVGYYCERKSILETVQYKWVILVISVIMQHSRGDIILSSTSLENEVKETGMVKNVKI